MVNLATQISNEESPLISMLKESAQSALVGAGLADANVVFGEEGVGKRQQISILQDSIITQFKRMLTPTESEYKKNMELLPSLLANNTQYSINKTEDGNLINVSDL